MATSLIERDRPKQLDYKEIFATTMYEMICEIFPAHGIEQMDEEEFDQMVTEITREHYWPILGEFRKKNGLSLTTGIRFRW
jgi:hypothetical protein